MSWRKRSVIGVATLIVAASAASRGPHLATYLSAPRAYSVPTTRLARQEFDTGEAVRYDFGSLAIDVPQSWIDIGGSVPDSTATDSAVTIRAKAVTIRIARPTRADPSPATEWY